MDFSEIVVGRYRVLAAPDKLPSLHADYRERAVLADDVDLANKAEGVCFFAVGLQRDSWPELVVSQSYEPAGHGFNPGILIAAESDVAFIGAGTRLLAYRLTPSPQRLWIDRANTGFWYWAQSGDVVLMAAELELAAWSIEGEKLWTTFVEPPWSYSVSDEQVRLDVMGTISTFPLRQGPRFSAP